jgi:hypothetical protein
VICGCCWNFFAGLLDIVNRGSESDRRGFARRSRPTYALANVGHPSDSLLVCYYEDSCGSEFGKTCELSELCGLSRFLCRFGVVYPRPESGGPASSGRALVGDQALGSQLFECHVDAFTTNVAMKESSDFFSGQALRGFIESQADTIQNSVSRGGVKDQGGAGRAVIPYGKGSLEMGRLDDRAAVKGRVDGTQAENLGFGAAGGSAEEAGAGLA